MDSLLNLDGWPVSAMRYPKPDFPRDFVEHRKRCRLYHTLTSADYRTLNLLKYWKISKACIACCSVMMWLERIFPFMIQMQRTRRMQVRDWCLLNRFPNSFPRSRALLYVITKSPERLNRIRRTIWTVCPTPNETDEAKSVSSERSWIFGHLYRFERIRDLSYRLWISRLRSINGH